MATTVNSGYVATGITLTGNDTLTNTSTGAITNTTAAVYGVAGTAADTVVNAGSIAGGGDGAGVTLRSGGTVTNESEARVRGASGVGISGYRGTVINRGFISASATSLLAGVVLGSGGVVDNQAGATISAAYRGVNVGGGGYTASTVTNSGRIISGSNNGISVYGSAGTVANRSGGSIAAGNDGIYISAGTATNQGTITAARHGIFMNAGGSLTNQTGGSISGSHNGVVIYGAGSVTNQASASITGFYVGVFLSDGTSTLTTRGTIGATYAGAHWSVVFGAGSEHHLMIEPGAVFIGMVDGGNTIGSTFTSTLELGSGSGTGTISGFGSQYTNFAAVTAGDHADWLLSGDNSVADRIFLDPGATLTNAAGGTLIGGFYAPSGGANRVLINKGLVTLATAGAIINLQSGGTVSNASSATISGIAGIDISGAAVISNRGKIIATGAPGSPPTHGSAILLRGGGTLDNYANATISGEYFAVGAGGGVVTVTNRGYVYSKLESGVALTAGGTVANIAGGQIIGHYNGVNIYGGAGLVTNTGSILGGTGVALGDGGSVTNGVGGAISATGVGVVLRTVSGTVVNQGSITGASFGVALGMGGLLVNEVGGQISGYFGAGIGSGGPNTVVNRGSISGSGPRALYFDAGNTNRLVLGPGATFVGAVDGGNTVGSGVESILQLESGSSPGLLAGLGSQFVNFSRVEVDSGAEWTWSDTNSLVSGMQLTNSGVVTGDVSATGTVSVNNASTGTISGNAFGVSGDAAGLTVMNAGVIMATGSTSVGVVLNGGGVVQDTVANSRIVGNTGVVAVGGISTIVTAGTVAGLNSASTAVRLATGYANLLVVDPGAVFIGNVDGGNVAGGAVVSTLELASAASTGSVSGIGSKYIGFAQFNVDAGASWQFTGTNTLAVGSALTNFGALDLDGDMSIAGMLTNNGAIAINSGVLAVGSLIGTGSVTIDTSSTLAVTETVETSETIDFGAAVGGFLDIGSTQGFAGLVSSFGADDTIMLDGVTITTMTLQAGNTLEVNFATGDPLALRLDPAEDFSGVIFQSAEVSGNALITQAAACFAGGTLLRTDRGERAVERLAVGDRVVTVSGDIVPIIWIGHRRVAVRSHVDPRCVQPVCIHAHAFGKGLPQRDLWLSPDHAIYAGGVLIPVKYLIDGRLIVQQRVDTITYYHVELPQHDVLFAEGLPTESYLDTGDRATFSNGDGAIRLFPDFSSVHRETLGTIEAYGYAPLVISGPKIQSVRRRLADRARYMTRGRPAGIASRST